MNRIERLFALRVSPPFASLFDSELAALAEVATVRRIDPGAFVFRAGQPVHHLVVVAEGALVDARGHELSPVLGAAELLRGGAASADALAHPRTGATCLMIARAHVLTLVNELPAVLLALQARGSTEVAP